MSLKPINWERKENTKRSHKKGRKTLRTLTVCINADDNTNSYFMRVSCFRIQFANHTVPVACPSLQSPPYPLSLFCYFMMCLSGNVSLTLP